MLDYKLDSYITSSLFYVIKLRDLLIIIGFSWLRFYRAIINLE